MNDQNNSYGALILAAGKGTRMHSNLPKVLHELLGESMLGMVVRAVRPLCGERVWSVIGHEAELVRACLGSDGGNYVRQQEQLGTGHALAAAWPDLEKAGLEYVLVVNGDTPLISSEALEYFAKSTIAYSADLAFMTLSLPEPGTFGRVLRKDGKVAVIIEAKDYNPQEHGPEPNEINAGIYFLRLSSIGPLLDKIENRNKSGEYYITDLVGLAVSNGLTVVGLNQVDASSHTTVEHSSGIAVQAFLGINNPLELTEAEEYLRAKLVRDWQTKGVIIRSAHSVRISPRVQLEPGCEICGPCEIYGQSRISKGASLDSHCWLKNTSIATQAKIRSFCHLEGASIGERCTVGPYARLRPGSVLETEAHVGNFVEMKKARLGPGAKAGHLSYLGDTEVGEGSNIGAGTITCNYDGLNKHKTIIGENAFIGSNTALIAPVTIGKGALVGAGSVITRDVPDYTLAVARGKQTNLPKRQKK